MPAIINLAVLSDSRSYEKETLQTDISKCPFAAVSFY